jgi:hypothetical protein
MHKYALRVVIALCLVLPPAVALAAIGLSLFSIEGTNSTTPCDLSGTCILPGAGGLL